MFKSPFKLMVALTVVVATMHWLALTNNYYWAIWWYDIMMHFLGGCLVALILLWLDRWQGTTLITTFVHAFLWIMVVGLAWEIYELSFGLTFVVANGYLSDTMLDLIMNTIGATTVYFIFQRKGKALFPSLKALP